MNTQKEYHRQIWSGPPRNSMILKRQRRVHWTLNPVNDNALWLCPECSVTPDDGLEIWSNCHLFNFCPVEDDKTRDYLMWQRKDPQQISVDAYKMVEDGKLAAYHLNPAETNKCQFKIWDERLKDWRQCAYTRNEMREFNVHTEEGKEEARARNSHYRLNKILKAAGIDQKDIKYKSTWQCRSCSLSALEVDQEKPRDFLEHSADMHLRHPSAFSNRYYTAQLQYGSNDRVVYVNAFGDRPGSVKNKESGMICQNPGWGGGLIHELENQPCHAPYGLILDWIINEEGKLVGTSVTTEQWIERQKKLGRVIGQWEDEITNTGGGKGKERADASPVDPADPSSFVSQAESSTQGGRLSINDLLNPN
ncbi:hypothetical protein BDV96DRAFT_649032 [Lophiotrema nucula]|uniref:Uncharacterized protein n=1 Tax=Lophiotrema nucula TaxID=690887 RepID=A0A6A5Z040_9PLEO|nr:hypothetical protein BDV96DRAFT_649032 [Lophiotrema nucula]